MKKYFILFFTAAALIVTTCFVPLWAESMLHKADFTKVQMERYTQTVTASGKIEYGEEKEIILEVPVIPEVVYAEIGDKVKIGDVLATIDKEETCAAAMSLLGSGGLPASAIEAIAGQSEKISDILDILPDTIVATAGGTITRIDLAEGAISLPNTPLAVISDTGILQVKAAVNEASAAELKEGQSAVITGSALKEKKVQGTVIKIYPAARKQYTGTVQETVVDVMIQLEQPDPEIKSGYSVKATIETQAEKRLPVLSYEAIGQDEAGEYVYTYQNGQARKKYITTGAELPDAVEITGGILPEDIVLKAPDALKEGMYVKLK